MRTFKSGATRDEAMTKPSYRGFLSPLALKRFGQYMLVHQRQADGKLRASDNWKRGIPREEYLESLLRHTIDLWDKYERTGEWDEDLECAILFNGQGLLHETVKAARRK